MLSQLKCFITFIFCLIAISSSAVTFDVDGIRYKILSQEDHTVSVAIIPKSISYPTYSTYQGDIIVPDLVTFNEVVYKVIEIGDNAFSECNQLNSVSLPSSIKKIGFGAFAYTSLTALTIPDGVEYIGPAAFRDSRFTNLYLPNSVNNLETTAFANCRYLQTVHLPENIDSIKNDMFSKCSALEKINVPSKLKYIGSSAFWSASSLSSFELPESIEFIGSGAFAGSGIISVTLPKNITALQDRIFSGCSKLQTVSLPERLTSLGEEQFRGCRSLSSISIPEGIEIIPMYSFKECFKLEEVKFPSTLKQIWNDAFSSCQSLHCLVLPEGLISISSQAFYGCTISELTLPNSLESIGTWAFGIKDLKQLILPPYLKSIGSAAFDDCLIEEVVNKAEKPISSEESIFNNDTYLYGKLIVPKESLTLYKSTAPWSSFLNIEGREFSRIEEINSEVEYRIVNRSLILAAPGSIEIYDIDGRKIYSDYTHTYEFGEPGIYIIKLGSVSTKIKI